MARQVEDCRQLAAAWGGRWLASTSTTTSRPTRASGAREYERMLADLADGLVDGVLVYHVDRLTRRPIELEQFLAVVDAAKVSTSGSSPATPTSAPATVCDGAHARCGSRQRVGRNPAGARKMGRTRGGQAARRIDPTVRLRADDTITVRPDEAEVYRALVARFLAGESPRSLATWLNDRRSRR